MRWPWQTREDEVIELVDRVLAEAEQARREHDDALRRLRDAIPKPGSDQDDE